MVDVGSSDGFVSKRSVGLFSKRSVSLVSLVSALSSGNAGCIFYFNGRPVDDISGSFSSYVPSVLTGDAAVLSVDVGDDHDFMLRDRLMGESDLRREAGESAVEDAWVYMRMAGSSVGVWVEIGEKERWDSASLDFSPLDHSGSVFSDLGVSEGSIEASFYHIHPDSSLVRVIELERSSGLLDRDVRLRGFFSSPDIDVMSARPSCSDFYAQYLLQSLDAEIEKRISFDRAVVISSKARFSYGVIESFFDLVPSRSVEGYLRDECGRAHMSFMYDCGNMSCLSETYERFGFHVEFELFDVKKI